MASRWLRHERAASSRRLHALEWIKDDRYLARHAYQDTQPHLPGLTNIGIIDPISQAFYPRASRAIDGNYLQPYGGSTRLLTPQQNLQR